MMLIQKRNKVESVILKLFESLTSVLPKEDNPLSVVVANVAQLAKRRRESLSGFLPLSPEMGVIGW